MCAYQLNTFTYRWLIQYIPVHFYLKLELIISEQPARAKSNVFKTCVKYIEVHRKNKTILMSFSLWEHFFFVTKQKGCKVQFMTEIMRFLEAFLFL